jgi:integrase
VKWTNVKERKRFLSTLKAYAYPFIGKLAVGAIDKTLVLKVLNQNVRDKKGHVTGSFWMQKNPTARRVRGRIEDVLAYARVNGWRDGENPAAWEGNLEHALAAPSAVSKTENHPALPYLELPQFMAALRSKAGMPARALELLILTALRTNEVRAAQWSEIDLEKKLWTIRADRMKADKEHVVPLTSRAIALLKALPREAEFVFIGPRAGQPIGKDAIASLFKSMGYDGAQATVHGFRSTFSTWASETTAFPAEVREMALAHAIGNKVEAAYRRGALLDKRKRLMDDWAKFCNTQPVVAERDNVTPIRKIGG